MSEDLQKSQMSNRYVANMLGLRHEDKDCVDVEVLCAAAGRAGVYARTRGELMMSE